METMKQEEICTLIDKLTLQMLDLMEEKVQMKVNIEKVTKEGGINLAKTRYTKGSESVSALHIPTEDSKEFNALMTLEEEKDDMENLKLNIATHEVDKESGHIDPAKWFGVLVPMTLNQAKDHFKKGIELSVDCANVQIQLDQAINNIQRLKEMKQVHS